MQSSKVTHLVRLAALAALVALGLAGCDQISSRREIQRANKLYGEGPYRDAALPSQAPLCRPPRPTRPSLSGPPLAPRRSLAIGHHTAGLAYYKLFQPGVESKANTALAERAAA